MTPVTITPTEYLLCKSFARERSEDSEKRGLKHSLNGDPDYLASIQTQSVIAEFAVAKLFNIPFETRLGRFHEPDLTIKVQGKSLPVDVKWNARGIYAMNPKLRSAPIIFCVSGWVTEEGGEMDCLGIFPTSQLKTLPLSSFGKPDRPLASVLTEDDLIPTEALVGQKNSNENDK